MYTNAGYIDIHGKKPHLQQVDYIRAIASLAVALFHLGGKTLPVLQYGWLGVYMFFLLSGFIVCWAMPRNYSLQTAPRFISKRLIRIEPPYIISIVLALAVNFLFTVNYHPDWKNVLGHIAYVNNFTAQPYLSPVYWTLGIEFQFYLFLALCLPLIRGRFGVGFLLLLSLMSALLPVGGQTLAGLFPVFALGVLYYLYYTGDLNIPKAIAAGIPIIMCGWYILGWLPALASLTALFLLILPLRGNKLMRFFANISFSLYLTHDLVGSNLVVYMGKHLPKTFFYKGVEFTCGIIASIAFACLFYVTIERICLRLSKQIAYPKAA